MDLRLSGDTLFLSGELDYKSKNLKNLKKISAKIVNLDEVSKIDYATAVFLQKTFKNSKIICKNDKIQKIINLTSQESILNAKLPEIKKDNFIKLIGFGIFKLKNDWIYFCTFLGEFLFWLIQSFFKPSHIRFKELSNYIKDTGINAIFIVCLTSFLIGIVLAYQGAAMLERFGASIFVVDIMGIMTLREVGPLIAAIVVAGRTASSYTAQIGVMKLTEEIDAMKTMSFEPFSFIVMPRVFALVLAMPLVVFFANSVSIFGQMLVCNWYMDLSFFDYLSRFKESISIRHFWVGILKAPFFGLAIALIGCMRGFEVSGNTTSVGKYTTKSVVNAIFWIIALDAGFSIIYTELKI